MKPRITIVAFLAGWLLSATALALPLPSAYYPFDEGAGNTTVDLMTGPNGTLNGGTIGWTAGHTGGAGDFAVDFKNTNDGNRVDVPTGAFAGNAVANNQISFSFWQFNPGGGAANESSFWARSPAAGGNFRGAQAHVPWSNTNVYWDTAGCCGGGTERINKPSPASNYDANWHHWVFLKNGNLKQIWVNGGLFHSGNNTDPLLPFSNLVVGAQAPAIDSFSGYIDDFAVFDVALTQTHIQALARGEPVLPSVVIPEPATITMWGLLGLCVAGVTAWRRRRKGGLELTDAAPGRQAWSQENRAAIRQMLDQHLAQ